MSSKPQESIEPQEPDTYQLWYGLSDKVPNNPFILYGTSPEFLARCFATGKKLTSACTVYARNTRTKETHKFNFPSRYKTLPRN